MIVEVHKFSRGTYGAPRIHEELKEDGHKVSRKQIARCNERSRDSRCLSPPFSDHDHAQYEGTASRRLLLKESLRLMAPTCSDGNFLAY